MINYLQAGLRKLSRGGRHQKYTVGQHLYSELITQEYANAAEFSAPSG